MKLRSQTAVLAELLVDLVHTDVVHHTVADLPHATMEAIMETVHHVASAEAMATVTVPHGEATAHSVAMADTALLPVTTTVAAASVAAMEVAMATAGAHLMVAADTELPGVAAAAAGVAAADTVAMAATAAVVVTAAAGEAAAVAGETTVAEVGTTITAAITTTTGAMTTTTDVTTTTIALLNATNELPMFDFSSVSRANSYKSTNNTKSIYFYKIK